MTVDEALEQLKQHITEGRADGAAAYHKVARVYLGITNPDINDLTKHWRQTLTVEDRVSLADGLWKTDIFEARLAAAKILTQARLRPDAPAWELIQSWVPAFDSWAIADHACMAGQKRLIADPTRIDTVENWTKSDHMWTRRAALVITLPWTKMNNPKPKDIEIRDRILGWAADYVDDPEWFIQKSVAWWLRDLSKHDAPRVVAFLDQYGDRMKPFARKNAAKYLS
ncbi:MAG: DNA alkylation repair protein [Rhodobacterales bacterium]|nr:DNA alkylation repair protein [Rhodobacterales bacterium]